MDETKSPLFVILGSISHVFSSLKIFQTHVPASVWPQRSIYGFIYTVTYTIHQSYNLRFTFCYKTVMLLLANF